MPKAIITADIVNSTSLSKKQEEKLISVLSSILEPYKFEFYRGDSFQVYVKDSRNALKLILQIRLAAKKLALNRSTYSFDIRASIGIGNLPTSIRNLKTATGEAFILSGRAFDEMHNSETRLTIQSSNETINSGFRLIAHFVDHIFKELTAKQAVVVFELLSGKIQMDIAKKLKKSQGTINKHVQSSGWYYITYLLDEYQQLINQL